MASKEIITRISMQEAKQRIANGEGKTDFDTPTDYDEVERIVATDPDCFVPDNWRDLTVSLPDLLSGIGKEPKKQVSVRYSPQVIDYFKSTGKGWQTRMDAVLSAYVAQQQAATKPDSPKT